MPGKFFKIATEEAFSIPEVAAQLQKVARSPSTSLDMLLVKAIYDPAPGVNAPAFRDGLLDFDRRLKVMDEHGVDMHVLSLTAPGVQMFDADTACALATVANDRLAAEIAKHPTRYAGLASFAPQAPARAAKEMQRAVNQLHLNGFVVNSHTNDEYLDDPKFWPILEAAEALDRCIYIHPRAPSAGLAAPMRSYGMDGALWGYGVEVGTHAIRMILGGVFDRFPKLTICLGHMGEAIHFWRWRVDFMANAMRGGGRDIKCKGKPSDYMVRNFVITTSGVEDDLALDYSLKALGADSVMWAIDYPYQPTAPAVAWMDATPLSDVDKARVYGGNARRLFHIKAAQ